MPLEIKEELTVEIERSLEPTKINESIFSKDYVDFLNEAGHKVLIYKSKKFGIPCDRKFDSFSLAQLTEVLPISNNNFIFKFLN